MMRNNMHVAVAEELESALSRMNIRTDMCEAALCGHIHVDFETDSDAKAMLMWIDPGPPGSLRDRASSGLVTLEALMEEGVGPDDPRCIEAMGLSWAWTVYPSFDGEGLGISWNVAVDMPADDAATLTAMLNSISLGAR